MSGSAPDPRLFWLDKQIWARSTAPDRLRLLRRDLIHTSGVAAARPDGTAARLLGEIALLSNLDAWSETQFRI